MTPISGVNNSARSRCIPAAASSSPHQSPLSKQLFITGGNVRSKGSSNSSTPSTLPCSYDTGLDNKPPLSSAMSAPASHHPQAEKNRQLSCTHSHFPDQPARSPSVSERSRRREKCQAERTGPIWGHLFAPCSVTINNLLFVDETVFSV